MQRQGIATDDLFAFITPHLGDVQPPGDVHFTAAGYDLLGGQVAESILAVLGSRKAREPKPGLALTREGVPARC
jgi:lysophospholipase L1-like esterase